jgi:hypothetical protein
LEHSATRERSIGETNPKVEEANPARRPVASMLTFKPTGNCVGDDQVCRSAFRQRGCDISGRPTMRPRNARLRPSTLGGCLLKLRMNRDRRPAAGAEVDVVQGSRAARARRHIRCVVDVELRLNDFAAERFVGGRCLRNGACHMQTVTGLRDCKVRRLYYGQPWCLSASRPEQPSRRWSGTP